LAAKSALENVSSTAYTDADSLAIFSFRTNDDYGNCARDFLRNPVTTASGTVQINTQALQVNDFGGCHYSIYIRITRAGNYTIMIGLGSVLEPLSFSPLHVIVIAGVPFPGACRAGGAALSQGRVGINETFLIYLFDSYGNPITRSGIDGLFVLERNGVAQPVVVEQTGWKYEFHRHYGTYNVEISGTYSINLFIARSHIFGSPFEIQIIPAPAAAEFCTAVQTNLDGTKLLQALKQNLAQLTSQIIGTCKSQPMSVVVFAKDRFSNSIYDVTGLNFSLQIDSANYFPSFIGFGAFRFIVSKIQSSGTKNADVLIKLGDLHISGSPFRVNFSDTCGLIAPRQSFLISPLDPFVAGESLDCCLQSVDSNGFYYSTGGFIASANTLLNNKVLIFSGRDMSDGTYCVAVNMTVSGNYTLLLTLQGSAISGSPFPIVVLPAHVSALRSSATGMTIGTAGRLGIILIQTRDRFSNVRRYSIDSTMSLSASLIGPTETSAVIVDLTDSTYSAEFTLTVSGRYQFSAMLVRQNLRLPIGNPLTIMISASYPDPGKSRFFGEGLSRAVSGAITEFAIVLLDYFSNSVPVMKSDFIIYQGNHSLLNCSVRSIAGDVTVFSYILTKSGQYPCTVYVTKYWINQSFYSFSTLVIPGNPMPLNTRVILPNSIISLGDTFRITVTSIDEYGNNCIGGGSLLSILLSGVVNLSASTVDFQNGTYSATLVANVIGQYVTAVTLNGQPCGQNTRKNVSFVPGHMDATCSIVSFGNGFDGQILAGQNFSFSVVPRDRLCNPTDFDTQILALDLLPSVFMSWIIQKSEIMTTYSTNFTKSGLFRLSVSLKGTDLIGSPQNITVRSSGIEPKNSVIYGCGGGRILAGAVSTSYIGGRDTFGNLVEANPFGPVPDYQVSLQSVQNNITIFGVIRDYQNRSFVFMFKPTISGNYILAVAYRNIELLKSAVAVIPGPLLASRSSFNLFKTVFNAGEIAVLVVRARDEFDNEVNTIHNMLVAKARRELVAISDSEFKDWGNFTFSIQLNVSDVYQVSVQWAGQHLLKSPSRITVHEAADPSALATVAWGGGTVGGQIGAILPVWLYARDEFQNAYSTSVLAKLSIALHWPSGRMANPKFLQNSTSSNAYYAEYRAQELGRAILTILLSGNHVHNSPYSINIVQTLSKFASAGSSFIADLGFSTVIAGSPMPLHLQSVSLDGLYMTNGGANIYAGISRNQSTAQGLVVTDTLDGIYHILLNPTVSGLYDLVVLIQGSPISGSPFVITVLPSDLDAGSCIFQGTGLTLATAGVSGLFSVKARDRFSNLLTWSPGPLNKFASISMHRPGHHDISDFDHLDGSYSVTFLLTAAGLYTLTIEAIPPATNTLIGSYVLTVTAAEPSLISSSLYGEGLSLAVAGRPADIRIDARDAHGNRATGLAIGSPFVYFFEITAEFRATFEASLFSISYLSTSAGQYQLQLNFSKIFRQALPISISAADPDPKACTLAGNGVIEATAGRLATFIITSRDIYFNRISSGGYTFRVLIATANSMFRAPVVDKFNGTYAVQYLLTVSGMIRISILKGIGHISGSPFQMLVQPAPLSPFACLVALKPFGDITAGLVSKILIYARDEYYNPKSDGWELFTVNVEGPISQSISTSTANYDTASIYAVDLTLTRSGTYSVSVSQKSMILMSGPMTIQVVGAQLSAVLTTATWPSYSSCPDRIALCGSVDKESLVIISFADVFGNSLDVDGNILSVSVLHNSRNVSLYLTSTGTVTIFTTSAGNYSASIQIQGAHISGSPWRILLSPSAFSDGGYIGASGNGLTVATAGLYASLKIFTRDRFGNPITQCYDLDAKFVLSSFDASQVFPEWSPVSSEEACSWSLAFNATRSGLFSFGLEVWGNNLLNSPYILTVKPGEALAAQSIATGSGIRAVMSGQQATVMISPRDKFRNLILGPIDATILITYENGVTVTAPVSNLMATYIPLDGHITYCIVDVLIGNGHVSGSPFTVSILSSISGDPVPENSFALGDSESRVVAGTSVVYKVQAVDVNFVYFNYGGSRVGFELVHSISYERRAAVDLRDGTYMTSFNLTSIGTYSLAITIEGFPISSSPFLIAVFPADISVAHCSGYGAGLSIATAGSVGTFTVLTRDRFQNERTFSTGSLSNSFSVGFVGLSSVTSSVVDVMDGTFAIKYRTTMTGAYEIHFLYGNDNSILPLLLTVRSALPTKVLFSNFTNLTAGDSRKFSAITRDDFGNTVPPIQTGIGGIFDIVPLVYFEIQAENESYVLSLNITKAGMYSMTAHFGQTQLAGGPLKFAVLPDSVCPQCSIAAGDGLTGCTAETVGSISVSARDRFGNLAEFEDLHKISLKLNQVEVTTVKQVRLKSMIQIEYIVPFVCLDCAMRVMILGRDVMGSPFRLSISPRAPPHMLSATLTKSLAGANIVFDVAVNQEDFPYNFNCAQVLDNASATACGNTSTCYWLGTSTLVMLFSSNSKWALGDLVGLKPGVIVNQQRNSWAASGTKLLTFPAGAIQPIASLQGPVRIGPCDSLALDASSSYGSGGRSFSFKWGLYLGPQNAAELARSLSLVPSTQDRVSISNTSLISGETYVFIVKVLSGWGQQGSQQLVVKVQSEDLPVMILNGPPARTVYSRQMIALRVQSQLSPCAMSSSPVLFSWALIAGPALVLSPRTVNSSTLLIPANQLLASRGYALAVRAFVKNNEISVISIILNVVSSPITAVISGGDRTVSNSSALVLDARDSQDPDQSSANFDFEWSCLPIPCFEDLGGIMLSNSPIISIPSGLLASGASFTFTVTVSKDPGPRRANASVVITVVDAPTVNVYVSIQGGPRRKFNPTERIALLGQIEGSSSSCYPRYSWTSSSGVFDPNLWAVSSISTADKNLALIPLPLLAGQMYIISLEVLCEGNVSGRSQVSLNINSPPLGGRCSAYPSAGFRYETVFSILCTDWADDPEDLPLLYVYSMESAGMPNAPLSSKITANTLSFVLPANNSNVVLLGTQICDSVGACSNLQQDRVIVRTAASESNVEQLFDNLLVKSMNLNNLEMTLQAGRIISSKISIGVPSRRVLPQPSDIAFLSEIVYSIMNASETVQILPDFVSLVLSTFSSVLDMQALDLRPYHQDVVDFVYQITAECTETGLQTSSYEHFGSTLSGILKSANNSAIGAQRETVLAKIDWLIKLLGTLSLKDHLPNEASQVMYGSLIQLKSQRYEETALFGAWLESALQDLSVGFANMSSFNASLVDAQIATWGILRHVQLGSRLESNISTVQMLAHNTPAAVGPLESPMVLLFNHPSALRDNVGAGDISNCKFWDANQSTWSRRGCIVVQNSSAQLVCWCFHLTDFAALLDRIEASIPGFFNPSGAGLGALSQLSREVPILTYVVIAAFVTTILLCALGHWADMVSAKGYSPPVAEVLFRRGFLTTASNNKASQYPSLFAYLWSNEFSDLTKRKHSLLSIFRRPAKDPCTRPARVLCLFVYLMSVMAFNVLWFEQVGFVDNQFATAGVLTAIMVCPVYPMCLALFSSIPTRNRSKRYLAKARKEQISKKGPARIKYGSVAPEVDVVNETETSNQPRSRARIEVESNIDDPWTPAPSNVAPHGEISRTNIAPEVIAVSADAVVEFPAFAMENTRIQDRVRIFNLKAISSFRAF
jgi:hypothetical protein